MNYIKNSTKNKFNYKILGCLYIFTFLIAVSVAHVRAQTVYQTVPNKGSIIIKGTSNLHEWETKSQQVIGDLTITLDRKQVKQINKVTIKIQVTSIKSGKGLMDSKTYEALNGEKFPVISYQSSNLNISPSNEITSIGQLTINGIMKSKTIKATFTVGYNGDISIKGNTKLKMTEFNIEPPTALLGTLRTRDDVEIQFEVAFKSNNNVTH